MRIFFFMHTKARISWNPSVLLKWWDEVCSQSGSPGLRPPKVSYFKALRGTVCYTLLAASGPPPGGGRLMVRGMLGWVLSGSVTGISCVTTETVLVLLADAGLSWHTVPFHHFHLDCFSTLKLLPCRAASSPQPTHLSDVSLTSPNRNVCSQETQAPPAAPFRAGEDV